MLIKKVKNKSNWKQAKSILEEKYKNSNKKDSKYYKLLILEIKKLINEEMNTGEVPTTQEEPHKKHLGFVKTKKKKDRIVRRTALLFAK